ncbi:MAG: P1 family peptidase, partial [Clostridium sp.]
MREIKFSDIDGIKLGHAGNIKAGTGCTTIICEKGGVCGVDIRGGAPGTRETDLLDPSAMVDKVHSIVLSGGSAFGLDSCSGVMNYLDENNIGFSVGNINVPIVCGAVIFDLEVGDPTIRPDKSMGYEAAKNSNNYSDDIQGNVGGGIGASVGKILGLDSAMKGGFGSYAIDLNGLQVGAAVLVNAMGDIICPETNEIIASALGENNTLLSTEDIMINSHNKTLNTYNGNTTIACIVTNASFSKAQAKKISSMA